MGNKGNENTQNSVVDFLYKDMSLINSFYSQYFNGKTNSIVKKEISADTLDKQAKVGLGDIFGGKVSSGESLEQSLESIIDPMDFIILQLIEALNINISNQKLEELNTGSIVGMKGNLMFRDYKVINELLPLISQGNLIPEFNQPINPKAKGKDKNFTIGKLMQRLVSIIPFGLEFEFITKNSEHITAIIKEEYLTIKPKDFIRTYGLNVPGEWTIIGIIDNVPDTGFTSKVELKSVIDEVTQYYYSAMNEGNNSYVLRPIVIYRKISS